MGLENLIGERDAVVFARSVGTTFFLLPEGTKDYMDNLTLYVHEFFFIFSECTGRVGVRSG